MSSPGPKGVGGPVQPTSPYLTAPDSELQRVFNFDAYHTNLSNGSSSPSDTLNLSGQVSSLPRHMNGNHHYVNFLPSGGQPHHSYLTMPQSPRSRIRTFTQNGSGQTTPSGSSSAETVREMTMDDCQGGGEEIFSTNKTKEQLYMEAKDILAMVSNGTNSGKRFPPDYVNLAGGISPGSTGPRRPPKSKHDRDPNSPITQGSHDHPTLPSQEATNRLLIGTTMLNGNRKSPARAFSPEREIIQNSLATLRVEKESQITLVSSLKRRLTDLEMKEEDDIRELEMERSLLIAEWEQETYALNRDIEECRSKLQSADEEFQRLEDLLQQLRGTGTEEEIDILEQLKRQHEVLDIERKIFEDKEFEFMEKDAKREEEKENLSKEISDLTSAMKKHEKQLQNVEEQQRKILMTVRRETRTLEGQRQSLIKQLEMERTKLSSIDERISKINTHATHNHQKPPIPRNRFIGSSQSRDLSKIPNMDSDHSDSDDANEVNHLHKSLSRLAMLDKSLEADLHRISVFEEDCSNGYNAYLSSQSSKSTNNLEFPTPLIRPNSAKSNGTSTKGGQSLNSIGGSQDSVTGSFSDIHTESLSSDESSRTKNSPSPNSERTNTSSSSTTRNISQNHRSKSSTSSESNPSTTTPGSRQPYRHHNHHLHHQRHDTSHHPVIIPRPGHSDFSEVSSTTNGSRPLSEVSSFWDDTDMPIEVKRRQNKATQQRPLTRYLPIRNEHFDLRQHIETAGHQIELCSHLILNASSCRGYLHKLGAKFKTWNKRWFVFDRHKRTLIYYHDKTETKAKGGIYFQAIEDVYIDHQNQVKSPNSKVTFCMKTADRPYYLMAPTPEAMRVWVDVIFTGAEGYQEFMNQ
ncbi:pleckstrin homology-like domain family B member 2 [Tigriopus californicus]|uniref:pleckstrin homology-like domain family B member 2 n=1 Tax=Tigriopus californicus TaxID=6832 RepID=UPI0027D9F7FE|nr:pleckstrin homology-like domain family B member 2 [Tigriopus californicus]